MKKILILVALLSSSYYSYAQKAPAGGKYSFFCDAINAQKTATVKGTYLGGQQIFSTYYDYYLEKVDALNHKFKVPKISEGKFVGMNVYLINEAALSINELAVKNNMCEGCKKDKLPFVVTLKNLQNKNEKDRIQHKTYTAHAGDYNKTEYGVETTAGNEKVDVYFPTKAQAEAFIEDIRSKGFK